MTDKRKRRVHLPEFKAKVGLEAVRWVKTISEIAQDYGVNPVQVSQWKREIQDQAKKLFEGKRGPQPVSAHSAPDRLYGEIGRLKMGLDWLKKSQVSASRNTPVFDQWRARVDAKTPMHACGCGQGHCLCKP
jgi:transposase